MDSQTPEPVAGATLLERTLGDIAVIALHEAGAIQANLEAAGEIVRRARGARNLRELIHGQLDLIPESRDRWRRDHDVRRRMWRGLFRDLAAASRAAPARLRRAG